MKIYNINNNLLHKIPLKKGSNSTTLNTSGWAKGVYVCGLEVGGKIVRRKKMVVAK